MTTQMKSPAASKSGQKAAVRIALIALAVGALAGCRQDHYGPKIAGWTLVEPRQRHPVLVSERPVTMAVRVGPGAYGLSSAQRNRVGHFLHRYRTVDRGNSKLVIAAPSGTRNEVSAMHAIAEVRKMVSQAGFPEDVVSVEPYRGTGSRAPIRITYNRVVAEGPDCGFWPENVGESTTNLSHANFACADQKNLAAMVANPADLLGPRTQTQRDARRRDQVWDKFIRGDSTVSNKKQDEKISTKTE